MLGFVSSLLALVRAVVRGRGDLVAENLLLRQQLEILTRPTRPQPRLRTRDKLFWILVRWLWRDWRRHLVLVRPETVVGWHRQGWALVWGGRSSRRPGRPRLDAETRALIARMARENPAWGSERIRGELLKLGIVVSKRSIQRYRRRGPARPPSQSWRTFLANHVGQIRAVDLATAADADLSAALHAALRHPPAAASPTCARDHEPDHLSLAAADRSDTTGAAAVPPDRSSRPHLQQRVRRLNRVGGPRGAAVAGVGPRCTRQPRASERELRPSVPGPPAHRPRAADAPRARGGRRVLRPRAPPPHADEWAA